MYMYLLEWVYFSGCACLHTSCACTSLKPTSIVFKKKKDHFPSSLGIFSTITLHQKYTKEVSESDQKKFPLCYLLVFDRQ